MSLAGGFESIAVINVALDPLSMIFDRFAAAVGGKRVAIAFKITQEIAAMTPLSPVTMICMGNSQKVKRLKSQKGREIGER